VELPRAKGAQPGVPIVTQHHDNSLGASAFIPCYRRLSAVLLPAHPRGPISPDSMLSAGPVYNPPRV